MLLNSCARIAGALLASSAIVAAANVAYANGQGTPVEPAPAPAPTVLEPAGPAPAVEAPAPVRKAGWGGWPSSLAVGVPPLGFVCFKKA